MIPAHGTSERSQCCSCVKCAQYARYGLSVPFSGELEHAWSLRRLLNACGPGTGARLKVRFGEESYAAWEANGIPDFDADAACIFLDKMPHDVYNGWYEAAADWYPEETE